MRLDYTKRTLTLAVAYAGPALAGKTSSLEALVRALPAKADARLASVDNDVPARLLVLAAACAGIPGLPARHRGFDLRVELRATPGAAFSPENRERALREVDGVVFVADSRPERIEANLAMLAEVEDFVEAHGMSLAELPRCLVLNRRDEPSALDAGELATRLARAGQAFESVAPRGGGVLEPLQHVVGEALRQLG